MKSFSTHIKETIYLSLPIIIAQLGSILMSVQDNIMIGWISELHLSTSALANSLYFIIFVLGMGITMAISPLVSESIGAKESQKTAIFLYQGLWTCLIVGLLLNVVTEIIIFLLPYMQQPENEVVLAIPYLRILNLGTIPMLFFLVIKQFCDGWSLTKIGMYITFIGLVFNFILNYLFIFIFKYDLVGAAWATTISKIIMVVLLWSWVQQTNDFKETLAQNKYNFNKKEVRNILKLGLPIGMQIFFELLAFGGATIMIGWLENATFARAAHQIAIGTAAVTFMCCSGFGIGASVRVGNFLGANQRDEMRQAAKAALFLTVILMSFFSILLLVFQHQIPLLYGVQNPELLKLTASLFVFAAAFQLFDGVQVVAAGILRGAQDIRFPTWIIVTSYTIVCLPLSYVLSFYLDFNVFGFWWGFLVTLTLVSVALVARIFWIIK